MDRIERIERATAFASNKVNAVSAGDVTKPTPCSEFDVQASLNHMIGGLAMMATAAQGDKAPMPLAVPDDASPQDKLVAFLGRHP